MSNQKRFKLSFKSHFIVKHLGESRRRFHNDKNGYVREKYHLSPDIFLSWLCVCVCIELSYDLASKSWTNNERNYNNWLWNISLCLIIDMWKFMACFRWTSQKYWILILNGFLWSFPRVTPLFYDVLCASTEYSRFNCLNWRWRQLDAIPRLYKNLLRRNPLIR